MKGRIIEDPNTSFASAKGAHGIMVKDVERYLKPLVP